MSIRYPSLAPAKQKNDTRSCESCNLTVMAKGDAPGWKGVDVGQGRMMWFCDKLPCRQKRDETISKRSQEMVIEQAHRERVVAENQELEQLRARVAAQDEELAQLRQSTAGDDDHLTEAGKATKALERDGLPDDEPVSAPIETHISATPGGKPLCGGEGPTVTSVELTWDTNPCTACATKWAKIQAGEDTAPAAPEPDGSEFLFAVKVPSASEPGKAHRVTLGKDGVWACECKGYRARQTCRHLAVGQKLHGPPVDKTAEIGGPTALTGSESPSMEVESTEAPPQQPTTAAAKAALYGERPAPPTLESMPRFTPDLIGKVQADPGSYLGKPILVPPAAYPDLNMAVVEAEKLRSGIGGLFNGAGLQVDRIERATKGETVVGIVFTLKRH
jgi:hypothetical protein